MTLDLSHLAASIKEEAFHDAPTRIRFVQTARWVEFARGRLALEELERRYQYPSCARMPCMLLYGDSGMGKTMLIEKMERQHPNSHHERRGLTLRPVLRVQMPASPDERRFYIQASGNPRCALHESRSDWCTRGSSAAHLGRKSKPSSYALTRSIIYWRAFSASSGGH
jgi:hypothetical protein